MTAYAFWNNKGGVGKSFLGFVAATEYAHTYPETDVYVIDLCPQADISETLLAKPDAIHELIGKTPRAHGRGVSRSTFELSLFAPLKDVSPYLSADPQDFNSGMLPTEPNFWLVVITCLKSCQRIRQTSQLGDSSRRVETSA